MAPLDAGLLAARLSKLLRDDDLLFIATDEQRAERIASGLAALSPDRSLYP